MARNVSPIDTAVVSVTTIHSGTTFNVIPQTAELSGTIRTFDPVVREMVLKRLETVNGVVQALNCTAEIQLESVTPAVINNRELALNTFKP